MFRHGINSGEWWCGPGSLFPGPLGMIVTLLFWGIILFLLFKGAQLLFSNDQRNSTLKTGTAEELLKSRYAQGQISREEFQQMQKDLQ